jgi:uncharacterized protein
MISGVPVIDAVTHGYNWGPRNWASPDTGRYTKDFYPLLASFFPMGEHVLDEEQWLNAADPDLVASALFAESQTDIAIYHDVPLYFLFKDGGSPIWVGERMRERWQDRVFIYGAVSPMRPGAVERVDELVDEHAVSGLKLYPLDVVDGEVKGWTMDDATALFPVLERAQQRGIRNIAIHKALPIGPLPMATFRPADVEESASAFPDLTFEIVHGGLAFVEETAWQVARHKNIVINLEATNYALVKAPAMFAQVLGSFLSFGAEDRIVWATGAMAVHPRPLIEAFWQFQIPSEMRTGFGLPELSPEIKRKILSGNAARMLGIDLDERMTRISEDEFAQQEQLAPPWSRVTAKSSASS